MPGLSGGNPGLRRVAESVLPTVRLCTERLFYLITKIVALEGHQGEFIRMPTNLVNDDVLEQVREVFKGLTGPVEVLFFGQEKEDCPYCEDALQLVQEVAGLSGLLRVHRYDLGRDTAIARQYKVDKAPGLVIAGRDGEQVLDFGIRFAGIPAGHEFTSLVYSLLLVSNKNSELEQPTRDFLASLKEPVHLQVFVTPTCPYCPRAVVLAHRMALESPLVEAEMVEAMEFPELSRKFNVGGVPQTTINQGAGTVIGAMPEDHLVAEIRRALTN